MERVPESTMVAGHLVLLILFINPELICLYIQFDLHPEKILFGHTHVSGIRFFFWDSQFGRFLNTGPIKGAGRRVFLYSYADMEFSSLVVFCYFA